MPVAISLVVLLLFWLWCFYVCCVVLSFWSFLLGKVWLRGGGGGLAVNCSNVHRNEKHIRIIIFNTPIAIKTNHQDRIRPEEAKADTGVYSVRKHGNILDLFRTENTFYLNKQQSRLLRTSNIYSPLKRAARFKPWTSNWTCSIKGLRGVQAQSLLDVAPPRTGQHQHQNTTMMLILMILVTTYAW